MTGVARAAERAVLAVGAASVVGVAAALVYPQVGTDAARTALAVVAVAAALALGAAAAHSTGPLRRAWACLAGGAVLGAYVGLDPSDSGPASLLARAVAGGLVVTALVSFPGTVRSARTWALLVLDGWLLGGSLFVALWLATSDVARPAGSDAALTVASAWVLADLVLASLVIALARRLPTAARPGALVLSYSLVLMCTGDVYRTVVATSSSGGQAAFVGCWAAALVAGAFAPWVDLSPFVRMTERAASRRPVRAPYLVACAAIAIAVVALALGRSGGVLVVTVVVTLLASVVASQTLLAVENDRLVVQLSQQADLFRDRATRDLLTGLPNREVFAGRVEMALTGPARGRVAVLFVDLDGFKDVNDSFGHAIGDELLVEAAGRLAAEVRETDVVARFGGDEFVALLADCSDETALEIAERLRRSLSEPYRIGHRDVVVSASIGLARPDEQDDADSAMRNADLALYRAKESGRDRVSVYEPGMHTNALRRLDAASRLRQALAHDRLALAFQPICDLRTGAIHSVEALLRFDKQDLADWSVTEVIQAAEESGLIVPLGGWVLDAAVSTLGSWLAAGLETRMHVNVSSRQLETGDFARQLENALLCYGVPAAALCLEITEHHLVRDLDSSARELERLRHLGVRVALDDFGTGYSSLSYLPRLPLDALKVDRELVARVGTARDTVPAVLRLGRDLGLTVIAEGIERVEQLVLLRSTGCTLGQGHLLSRPVGRRTAAELVRRGYVDLPIEPIFAAPAAVSGSQTRDLNI
ncbi:MAG TPA: EAL domain-containing protein [Candidatus Nanopelagicales bacterium]|nr:EAL domain-containing protein [Candidatus Nanopelagicales bacterium]